MHAAHFVGSERQANPVWGDFLAEAMYGLKLRKGIGFGALVTAGRKGVLTRIDDKPGYIKASSFHFRQVW